jgi:two-component system, OmpR family, response regulator
MTERPHILVVDDDRDIRTLLCDYLEKNGFRTSAVAEGKALRRTLEHTHVDLIVLDLMLPGDDGLTLCREIRARSQIPIIMLTALGEDIDRIVGMEVGADDYLPKPFNPRELLVRIRAVLRRAVHAPRDPLPNEVKAYRFAGWRLDVTSRTLTHESGTNVPLTGAEFRLLSVLLAHPHRVLSRVQLAELTRGRDIDPFDRSIDVRVSRLRQALGDGGRSPQIIKTIYGEGYLIGVEVQQESATDE